MSVLNDLVGYKNLKIYQEPDWFSFSLDSVLLPNFVSLNKNIKVIMDLCCGNAPIPLILSTKTNAKIIGVELQEDVYKLAKDSVEYNKLESQIEIVNMNIKDLKNKYSGDSIDVITCNPPYFKYLETSNINEDIHKVIARHEKEMTLDEIVDISHCLLKNNGVLSMVHRTDRLIEIIKTFNKYNLEVKKIRFIYPKEGSESNMILIEWKKNGNTGIKVLPPLYVHNEDGSYRDEVLEMFEGWYYDKTKKL